MPLLLSGPAINERRLVANGPLAPLARSLAAELEPLLHAEPFIPVEKARLTRIGGRCRRDGQPLDFDPRSPHAHRCGACGTVDDAPEHYRMWIMWYQLWLAERAARAATLHALCGDARHAELARTILERYAARYGSYPNRDNVLGPARPFFSTYLESIWLLQLCVALDLLEWSGGRVDGALVRDRLVAPSRRLIAGYDEGRSNRQVWNGAALLASARVLGLDEAAAAAIESESGLLAQLGEGVLSDGSWYEGENYHLFAHRGLWYGVAMAEAAGMALPAPLAHRFDEGFATPVAVALPDLTLPARRDSQYGVSLRQWRFAEMGELGLARRDDARLTTLLARLYDGSLPAGCTGRAVSSAEAERNLPAVGLTRADLGWRSLLHARAELPPLEAAPPHSVLLDGQGLAVLRREGGRIYVALDYGHTGGGHGHPDRLNLLLARDSTRWLDDPGTGSYVDPTLHWYRSTLAHNAPLLHGRSQQRHPGMLLAFEDRGAAGWVEGAAPAIAPDVAVVRTVVLMPSYVIDVLWWDAPAPVQLDLPWHIDAEVVGVAEWCSAAPPGSRDPEDGFGAVTEWEHAHVGNGRARRLRATRGTSILHGWVYAPRAEWWRATAPGPPGCGEARFLLARSREATGRVAAVWSWCDGVADVAFDDDSVAVTLASGERHVHRRVEQGWHIDLVAGAGRSSIDLGGLQAPDPSRAAAPVPRFEPIEPLAVPCLEPVPLERALEVEARQVPDHAAGAPLRLPLAAPHYRRSERSWSEAGAPTAVVTLAATPHEVVLLVRVRKAAAWFAPPDAVNEMDNEHPDVNSDGIQLHVRPHAAAGPGAPVGWLLVPEADGAVRARVVPGSGDAPALRAIWRHRDDGYVVACAVPRGWLTGGGDLFELDVLVNLVSPGRERREGQLVLSGGRGEFVYLRGDRQPADRLVPVTIRHG